MDYQDSIKLHYINNWNIEPNICYPSKGPANELPYDFRILEFPPTNKRTMWTYATCCMSQEKDLRGLELHLFSSRKDEHLVNILTAVAHYHRTGYSLGLNHTVNFGQPWQDNSLCEFGLISLPYLDGPDLENMLFQNKQIKFYWLIPITKGEVEFKKTNGIEALEEVFDEGLFNYLDPNRNSLV